jgi:hypothetical protein
MDLVEIPEYNGFRYILRVVDHISCYGYVASLRQKESEKIGLTVVKIISTSITPEVLQSDNGWEVRNKVQNSENFLNFKIKEGEDFITIFITNRTKT